MIVVRTWTEDESIWFEVTGHSEVRPGAKSEHIQVCAGVSALLLTLYILEDQEGEWDGDRSGRLRISTTNVQWATFAWTGVMALETNHPGHIDLKGEMPAWLSLPL